MGTPAVGGAAVGRTAATWTSDRAGEAILDLVEPWAQAPLGTDNDPLGEFAVIHLCQPIRSTS